MRDLENWATHPVEPTPARVPWKRSLGEACPHGLEIFLVDGTYIRNNFDSDFVQGGNGQRYRFCPKSELWIDDSIPEEEMPYVALHECYETFLMSERGYDYERAHDCAKRLENKFRREGRPGEEKYT
jgi:hypothetical protein